MEDNNLSLTFKTFFSGDYTQALEDSYNNSIPFPDAMKAVEERISLIYGIGNKVTDPIKETPDNTDSNHNSFHGVRKRYTIIIRVLQCLSVIP